MEERRRLKALESVFASSERRETRGLPIRVTARGLWVPTPFPALVTLFRSTRARRFFASPVARRTVLDAGTGDGRVLAALAYFEPALEVIGVESDDRLFRSAVANLETIARQALVQRPERLRVVHGDYRQRSTYDTFEVRPESIAFVLNYPDGNQDALERFVLEQTGRGTKLCLLTHDVDLRLSTLALTSKERLPVDESLGAWQWSVYST